MYYYCLTDPIPRDPKLDEIGILQIHVHFAQNTWRRRAVLAFKKSLQNVILVSIFETWYMISCFKDSHALIGKILSSLCFNNRRRGFDALMIDTKINASQFQAQYYRVQRYWSIIYKPFWNQQKELWRLGTKVWLKLKVNDENYRSSLKKNWNNFSKLRI